MSIPTGTPNDDWLTPQPQPDEVADEPSAARRPRFGTGVKAAALVVAGLLAGGGVAYAAGRHGPTNTATTGGFPGFGGQGAPGAPRAGGGFGGLDGEQHIQGTLTGTTSDTVTVKRKDGASTYTVTSRTQIVRNGRSATLADLRVGDPVLVHVYPSGADTLVERLFAGTAANAAGPGGAGGFGRGFGGIGGPPGAGDGFGPPPNQ